MGKYFSIFKISWQRELEYRFNFFLGRLRNIIVLILLYFLWHALAGKTGKFAGYTEMELFTYVFGVNIIRSIIFGAQSRFFAKDVNDGSFSSYLIKPLNYFWYIFSRELAQRSINLISAIIETIILFFILKPEIFWQTDPVIIFLFFISFILAVFLYFVFSYLVSMLAFWSREAMGPRFLFEWFLEFASGAYFPLTILGNTFSLFLKFLPFTYLIFFPITVYLGKMEIVDIIKGLVIQTIWIFLIFSFIDILWVKAIKKYSGEGI